MQTHGIKLDERDLKILAILQREGRITKAALAERVNLSPTPCWERLKRLEMAGVIEGYGARLSSALSEGLTYFFMEAELASHEAKAFKRFEQAVQNFTEIQECWAVGGGVDYILKIASPNVEAYQRFVDKFLDAQIGVKRYFTYVVTKRIKNEKEQVLPLSS